MEPLINLLPILGRIARDLERLLHESKSSPRTFRVAICLDAETFDELFQRVSWQLREANMTREHDGMNHRSFKFAGVEYLRVADGAALDDPYLLERMNKKRKTKRP